MVVGIWLEVAQIQLKKIYTSPPTGEGQERQLGMTSSSLHPLEYQQSKDNVTSPRQHFYGMTELSLFFLHTQYNTDTHTLLMY